jgi:hypothetical protein
MRFFFKWSRLMFLLFLMAVATTYLAVWEKATGKKIFPGY